MIQGIVQQAYGLRIYEQISRKLQQILIQLQQQKQQTDIRIKQLQEQLTIKDEQISRKHKQIIQRDIQIEQQNKLIEQRDRQLLMKDRVIQQLYKEISHMRGMMMNNNNRQYLHSQRQKAFQYQSTKSINQQLVGASQRQKQHLHNQYNTYNQYNSYNLVQFPIQSLSQPLIYHFNSNNYQSANNLSSQSSFKIDINSYFTNLIHQFIPQTSSKINTTAQKIHHDNTSTIHNNANQASKSQQQNTITSNHSFKSSHKYLQLTHSLLSNTKSTHSLKSNSKAQTMKQNTTMTNQKSFIKQLFSQSSSSQNLQNISSSKQINHRQISINCHQNQQNIFINSNQQKSARSLNQNTQKGWKSSKLILHNIKPRKIPFTVIKSSNIKN